MNKYILTAACGLAFSAASAQTKALPDSPLLDYHAGDATA